MQGKIYRTLKKISFDVKTSNMKTQNYKLVDLIEGYNFDIKCILI